MSPVFTSQGMSVPSFVFIPGPVEITIPEFTCCLRNSDMIQWSWHFNALGSKTVTTFKATETEKQAP